jgi:hypothetical protein
MQGHKWGGNPPKCVCVPRPPLTLEADFCPFNFSDFQIFRGGSGEIVGMGGSWEIVGMGGSGEIVGIGGS